MVSKEFKIFETKENQFAKAMNGLNTGSQIILPLVNVLKEKSEFGVEEL